ncbi:MAG: ABC transporter permease [Candidatus Promineifilaceae bacterium]|jgi:putative ABC transport system permease protein
MILKYILTSFGRRKVRTILMILSLMVSTGLIVTMSATVETIRRSNIDLIASETGRYDLEVSRKDTSTDQFVPIASLSEKILAADPRITAVYPRLEAEVEMSAGDQQSQATIIALDQALDDVGTITVIEGEYELEPGEAAVLEDTATLFDLNIGDTFQAAYSFPVPREEGKPESSGASSRRTSHLFAVKAIVTEDGLSGGFRDGYIADLADVQEWLNLPGSASKLIATVDPVLYETNNAEAAALAVRDVGQNVYTALGQDYAYSMAKAQALSGAAQAFLALQALINVYGLISLGVVGLLIYTLMLTNVQEQRRDMAILRILGAQRSYLFAMVIVEVLVIGVIGVGLGIILGQLITQYIAVPLIQQQFTSQGMSTPLVPQVSLSTILPAAAAAFFVLIVSSLKPAQEAANTKVVHAINPGVADNIQLEDLEQMRERSPNLRMFLGGTALMLIFALIASFEAVESFGGPAIQVTIYLLALVLLVLGMGLMFFIATVPLERLILFITGLISPRLTYFAERNVKRGEMRNTLISMLVLFSGVLPSFLATQVALDNANMENNLRQSMGAPLTVQVATWYVSEEELEKQRLSPSFLSEELETMPGIGSAAGLSYNYDTRIGDELNFKNARVSVRGVEGPLEEIIFSDMVDFSAGDLKDAFRELQADPQAVIISEGLAEHLGVELGGIVKLQGEGLDHIIEARIAGIARRIPGIEGIGRSRLEAENGSSTVLMSGEGFRRLITELNAAQPGPDTGILMNVLATVDAGSDLERLSQVLRDRFIDMEDHALWFNILDTRLERVRQQQASQQIFLLALTTISFTTAVFGVFAVIYVTIYARRIEIGMMKAMGMKRRELTGILVIEAIVMTLGAALAGIAAGAAMGYVTYYSERIIAQEHVNFAVDTTVVPFIVIMVVIASILGAIFSARRIVKKKAVEILRM